MNQILPILDGVKGILLCTYPDCDDDAIAIVLTTEGTYHGDATCGNEQHAAELIASSDEDFTPGTGDPVEHLREAGLVA